MRRGTFIKNCLYFIAAGSALFKLPLYLPAHHVAKKNAYEKLFSNLENGFVLEKYADEIGVEYLSMIEKKLPFNFTKIDFSSHNSLQRMIEKPVKDAVNEIQKMIRRDFGNNNTVRLKGWILSETEAKLSALYKMTT